MSDTQDSASLDPRRLEAPVHIRHVSEVYDGRTLTRLLMRKLVRRLRGGNDDLGPIVSYNGLVVFDQPQLDGGGLTYGADYARLFFELGISRVDRLFEFCAGPGYIGFFLFSLGCCRNLVLSDINPAAVTAARRTVEFNRLTDRVSVFQSEGLTQIPAGEKWDLVVGNPPHFLSADERVALRAADPGWSIHAAFYRDIGKFVRSGGKVILVENEQGSNAEVFKPMIAAGGGNLEAVLPSCDARGRPNGSYFVITSW